MALQDFQTLLFHATLRSQTLFEEGRVGSCARSARALVNVSIERSGRLLGVGQRLRDLLDSITMCTLDLAIESVSEFRVVVAHHWILLLLLLLQFYFLDEFVV